MECCQQYDNQQLAYKIWNALQNLLLEDSKKTRYCTISSKLSFFQKLKKTQQTPNQNKKTPPLSEISGW